MRFYQTQTTAEQKQSIERTQPTQWDKTSASYLSDEGFTSRKYQQLKTFNNQNATNPVKKWEKDQNRQFSKEEIHMANKYMETCSTSLARAPEGQGWGGITDDCQQGEPESRVAQSLPWRGSTAAPRLAEH